LSETKNRLACNTPVSKTVVKGSEVGLVMLPGCASVRRGLATSLQRRKLSSIRYSEAKSAISSLPELSAAKETPDASAAYGHLKRALDVVSNAGDRKLVIVAQGHLAAHCYKVGQAGVERMHRVAAIDALLLEEAESADKKDDGDDTPALLSAAYNGLALSCLRVGDAENLLAAGAAADLAERHATTAQMRLGGSLHAALARTRGSQGQRIMLSAIAGVGGDIRAVDGGVSIDTPVFATLFSGMFAESDNGGPGDEAAMQKMRDGVERWAGRADDFDMVESRCAAAREFVSRRGPDASPESKMRLDEAESFLTDALKQSERLGNKLDMSEPLLGLADLYAAKGRSVEAEGLYRSVEERFGGLVEKKTFTVLPAEVFCRSMDSFSAFLESVGRGREADTKRERAAKVRALYPEILGRTPHVPLWFVDSCIGFYRVP
jgi:hypothetical protein